MIREVELISYLPSFLQEYEEHKHIMTSETQEFNITWHAAERVRANAFITTADEYGIERFEKLLKIMPAKNETLEQRRNRVLSEWNSQVPLSKRKMIEKISALCNGINNFVIGYGKNSYTLVVRIGLNQKQAKEAVEDMLQSCVPMNVVLDVDLIYNNHEELGKHTHKYLKDYMHQQLRDTVL